MPDLAELGIRVTSQEAAVADKNLDDLAASATRAEASVDKLSAAARRSDGAVSTMNVAVRQQAAVMNASRNAMGMTAREGLNLSRQFADIGVTAAMGMNPLMIAIQQGPQLLDIFQEKALATGTTIKVAMMSTGRAMYAALAPFLPLVAGIAVAAGALAASWGLASRAITKDIGDVTKEMGLSEQQLEKLKDKNIATTATAGDAWNALGTTIKDMFASVFGDELAWVDKQWNSFLDDLTKNTGAEVDAIAGFFVGAFNVVRDTWRLLPAAIGDAAVSSANAAITAINWLIARSVEGINSLRAQYNSLPAWMRGGQTAPMMGATQIGAMGNQFAGGMTAFGSAAGSSYGAGVASMRGASGRFMDTWRENTRDSARARITAGAGDRGADDAAKKAKEVVEILQQLPNISLRPLNIALLEVVEPLKLIAHEMRLIDGLAHETAQGLASAFGETGRVLGDLLTTMSGFQARMAEINLAEKEYQITAMQAERERAYATIANYGDMLGAAKGFFQEGSDGYRFLQAAEAAYRVFQFAMSVQAIAQTAAETSASVAGSAAKGAASAGAGAAKMFEQLGPYAFPVVAAMLALLASLGMKGKGGGGGGSPKSVEASVGQSQGFSAQQDQARTSMFSSMAQQVNVRVTADKNGIHAYVAGVAEDTARPMVTQAVVAGAGATRAQVAQDMDPTYRRGVR